MRQMSEDQNWGDGRVESEGAESDCSSWMIDKLFPDSDIHQEETPKELNLCPKTFHEWGNIRN